MADENVVRICDYERPKSVVGRVLTEAVVIVLPVIRTEIVTIRVRLEGPLR